MVGSRVKHVGLGEGTVLDQRLSGMYLLVGFDRGTKLWVNRSALLVIPTEEKTPVRLKGPRPLPAFDNVSARKIIEALKLGIVPYQAVEEFTFGREWELEKVEEALSKKDGNSLILEGEYGAGKTHFLDFLYWWFLKRGYAVTRVEFDPFDVAPYRPKRVYRELARTLSFMWDGKERNFRDLLLLCADEVLPHPHLILSPALKRIREGHATEDFWAWVQGENLGREQLDYMRFWRLPVLVDHTPACDLYSYILTGLSYLLWSLDCKGLVLLMDEGETLFHLWSGRLMSLGLHFYKGLLSAARNRKECATVSLLPGEVSLSGLGVGKMDRAGYIHSGVRPVPYIYTLPTRLFVVMALTPSTSSFYEQLVEFSGKDNILYLRALSDRDVRGILSRIGEVYAYAFDRRVKDPELVAKVLDKYKGKKFNEIRLILRRAVEYLDFARHRNA